MPSYTVTFDRIGRNHDVPPATFEDTEPDDLPERIYQYGRRHLGSRDVDVIVDLDEMTGRFVAGVRNGGDFTLVEHQENRPLTVAEANLMFAAIDDAEAMRADHA